MSSVMDIGPDHGQSFRPLMIRDIYLRAFARFSDRECLSFQGQVMTYRELDLASNKLAHIFLERGVGHRDVIALLLRNSFEFMIADMAIAKIGAVKVPLNEMLSGLDVGYMLGHSSAKAVLAHSSFSDLVVEQAEAISNVPCRISVENGDNDLDGFEPYQTLMAAAPETLPARPELQASDPGLIIYTGGTTGRPKGVLHVQEALAVNLLSQVMNGEVREDERLLLCSPLPHSAQFLVEAGISQGARTTIMESFDPAIVLAAIETERLTWTFMVPTMIYRMLDSPDRSKRDLSSLRTLIYGASPITTARLQEALGVFGPIFLQLYGQSEAPNFITTLSKSDHMVEAFQASCGQPVIFCDLAIRDEDGAHLANGEVGEITLRSPYTLARYHDDPEKTKEAHFGDWLRTGDVGYQSDSGHVYLVDRAKDMIISGGMNVYSTEVENVVQEYSQVAQVMVIGLPDDDWGEAVTAFVVPTDGMLDREDLIAFCKKRLAKYKVPKSIEMIEEIPLTAYGKPDKKVLRGKFWSSKGRAVN